MTENATFNQEQSVQDEWHTMHSCRMPGFQDDSPSTDDIERINRIAPKTLRLDQVFVRSMYLCSSQPCETDHCRFALSALKEISQKIIGQSVLVGHNRSSLPLARFFKAEVIAKQDEPSGEPTHFVRAWFYWLRDTSGAKDLLLNIDGGIYREVSLAWRFQSWRCSVCGVQNGKCHHRPGERYESQKCERIIEHITDVMEGSLVYKGADKNTVLSGSRSLSMDEPELPVVLITNPDDPLLQYLEREQLISQRLDLNESQAWLQEGIEQLWFRSLQDDINTEQFKPLLCSDGISVLECYDNTNQPQLAFGTLQSVFASS